MQAVIEREPRQATLRVFLAEDSGSVVDSLAGLFAATGVQVTGVARTEAEALDWAASHPRGWDLAIVDLILDQGSGFGVIHRLKRTHAAGRVLVFSGYVSDVIRKHCESLGADLVLDKYQNEQLVRYVEQLTAAR